jgi:aspartate/methionine/tyrosine aminotransferase
MTEYIWFSSHGVSTDSEYRSYKIIKHIVDTRGEFFTYMKQKMLERWVRLNRVINNSNGKFKIQSPNGFVVAWVKCEDFTGFESCFGLFERFKMKVNDGRTYGGDKSFIRFNMQGDESTFQILIERLTIMIDFFNLNKRKI